MKMRLFMGILLGLYLYFLCPIQIEALDSCPLSGSGTTEDPYQIESSDDFALFRDMVNQGNLSAASATYRLTEDITLPDGSCYAVGTSAQDGAFSGIFDGGGHTISNLYQNGMRGTIPCVGGLFGQLTGTVKDLTVQGKIELNDIKSPARVQVYLGGIAGWVNGGTISYCRSEMELTLTDRYDRIKYMGGVCGKLNGTVDHCYYNGRLFLQNACKTAQNSYVGGVAACKGEQPYLGVSHCCVQCNPTQETVGMAHTAVFPSAEEKTETELLRILNGERADGDLVWVIEDNCPVLRCETEPTPPEEFISVSADREEYTYGDEVTLTAEIDHPYTGEDVTFWHGEMVLGTAEVRNGRAVLVLPRLSAGVYDEITAGYPDSLTGHCPVFTIKPAVPDSTDVTFRLPESGCVYDGTPKAAQAETVDGLGAVTLHYQNMDGGDITNSPPVSAGTYSVSADIAASQNYTAIQGLTVGTIIIYPAEIYVDWNQTVIDSRPYAEGDCSLLPKYIHPVFTNLPSGQTISDMDYLIADAQFEDDTVGKKSVTFTLILQNGNYCFTEKSRQVTGIAEGTITPNSGYVTVNSYDSHIYDGKPVPEPTDLTKTGDGEVTFRWFRSDGTMLIQPPSDVGTYMVQPILSDGKLYGGAVGEKIEFTITYLTCGTAQLKGTYTRVGDRRWYHTVTLIPSEGYLISEEEVDWQDTLSPPLRDGRNVRISYRLQNEMGQISALKSTVPMGVDNTPPTISLTCVSATENTLAISSHADDSNGSGTAVVCGICCPATEPVPTVQMIQSKGKVLKEGIATFKGLHPANHYKVYVIAQDWAENISPVYAVEARTLPRIPDVSQASIHYVEETLTFPETWEANTQTDFYGKLLKSGERIGTLAGESVFLRIAANQGFGPSDVVELKLPTRPENITPPTIDYMAETLMLDAAGALSFESKEIDHQGKAISIKEHMGETVRYRRAATNQAFASASAEYEIPARPHAPEPIAVTACTTKSITIRLPEGCEVRLEGRPWQTETTFNHLVPGHSYRIETRYRATQCAFASELITQSVTTKRETPVVIGKLKAVYGKTLGELEGEIKTLSAEVGGVPIAGTWHWAESVDQSIKPQVGEFTPYEAVFTPERSDCYPVNVSIVPEIEPEESTVVVTEAPDKVYDGILYRETVKTTVTGSNGDIHLDYFEDEACKIPATPYCVGTYWVRPSVEGDRNHKKAVGKAVPFTIQPVLLHPVADDSQVRTRPYDGKTGISGVQIQLAAAEGYKIPDWQSPKATGRVNSVTPNAGERKLCISDIVLTDDWSSGYALTTDTIYVETDSDLISQRPVTLEWHEPTSAIYDGTEKIVTVEVVTSDSMEPVTVELTGAKVTYAGSYTAEAVALSSKNYALPQDGTTKYHFSIIPAKQTFIAPARMIPAGTEYALPARTNEGGVISYSLEGTVPKGVTIQDGALQGGTAGDEISFRAVAISIDLNGDGTPEFSKTESNFTVTITKGEALPLENVTLYKTYGDEPFYLPLTYAGSSDNIQYTVVDGWDVIRLEGRYITLRGAGTATLTAVGSAPNYEDASAVVTINIEPRDFSHVVCSGIAESYPYTGKAIRPTVQLLDIENLEKDDYTITYDENKTVATGGTITITGKGRYCGSKTLSFTITPAQMQGTPRFQCLGTTFDTVTVDYSDMNWYENSDVCGSVMWFTPDGKTMMKSTVAITPGAVYQWRFIPDNANYSLLTGQIQLLGQNTNEDAPSGDGSSGSTPHSAESASSIKGDNESVIELFLQLTATENGESVGTVSVDQIQTILKQINQPSSKKPSEVVVILNATECQMQPKVLVSIPAEVVTLIGQGNNKSKLIIKTDTAVITLSQTELAKWETDAPLIVRTELLLPQLNAKIRTKYGAKRPTQTDGAMQQLADEGNPVVCVTPEMGGTLWRAKHRVMIEIPMDKKFIKAKVVLAKTKTGLQLLPVTIKGGEAQFVTQEFGTFAVVERTDVPVELLFHDIAREDWNRDAVGYVVKNGMMVGTSPHRFSPKQSITRAMLVTMLYRAAGTPETTGAVFGDTKDSWCEEAVSWAAEHEIVNGFDSDMFAPNAPLTREQMVTILYRYTQRNGGTPTLNYGCLKQFNDDNEIHEYARDAMAWAVQEKILTGTTPQILCPSGYAQRDQTAVILMRYLERA